MGHHLLIQYEYDTETLIKISLRL